MSATPSFGSDAETKPFVTVIMPVRNEGLHIARSIAAVLAQDYPPQRIEVLVADGRSTNGTRELLRELEERHRNLRVLDNPRQIVATGLNLALHHAKGDVVVRVDGHCEIAPDYVSRCVGHLLSGEADGVGGPLETIGEDFVSKVIALAMSTPFGVGGAPFRTIAGRTLAADTVAFPAYTRATIDRAGYFDEELVRNQDDEYNFRLRALGYRILLAADVRSRYYSRSSIRSLWRQYFQYGFFKVRVMQKHSRQMKPRHFAPPVFALLLLTSLLAASVSPLARGVFALVAGSYLIVNFGASLLAARRGGWRLLPLLPIAFATLHLAYGLGFLAGLVRFAGRWGDRGISIHEACAEEPQA